MKKNAVNKEQYPEPIPLSRISWGAILSGVVAALSVYLVLSLFGLSMQFGAMDFVEGEPFSGLATSSAIFTVISVVVSFFIGGWIAAYLSGYFTKPAGLLHGFTMGSISSIALVLFFGSWLGSTVGGVSQAISDTTTYLGQGVGSLIRQVDLPTAKLSKIEQEVTKLLRQTDKAALQPENLSQEFKQGTQELDSKLGKVARRPEKLDNVAGSLQESMGEKIDRLTSALDKDAAANILVARTDMSHAEAEKVVTRWIAQLKELRTDVEQFAAEAETFVLRSADSIAASLSQMALLLALALLLGLAAASGGGFVAANAERRRREKRHTKPKPEREPLVETLRSRSPLPAGN